MKDYMLTVMAQDRVGIISDVSNALTDLGGNITRVSQTVVRNYFTLIISVEIPDETTELELKHAVERNGGVGEFEVNVRPFREPIPGEHCESELFTLSMQGKDRPGIIARTTNYLAERGINIEDFYAYTREDTFLLIAQVSVPIRLSVEEVQSELEAIGAEYGFVTHLQHANIFRATSDVQPVITYQGNKH